VQTKASSRPACPLEFKEGKLLPIATLQQWLGRCGKEVKVYEGSRLVPPERISIGDHSQIDEGVCIFAGEGVEIGSNVHLAFGSSISGGGRCILHDFVGIGAGTRLITGTELVHGLTNPTIPPNLRTVERSQVVILPHALVFTNSIVLPGVTIGEGAVVSAGSIVHRDLKPWTIYGGNPLVAVGSRSREGILKQAHQFTRAEKAADPI
jgi:acetyltransferase-like isoleucine patch superfamily enzyme